jgi:hypothetical protein
LTILIIVATVMLYLAGGLGLNWLVRDARTTPWMKAAMLFLWPFILFVAMYATVFTAWEESVSADAKWFVRRTKIFVAQLLWLLFMWGAFLHDTADRSDLPIIFAYLFGTAWACYAPEHWSWAKWFGTNDRPSLRLPLTALGAFTVHYALKFFMPQIHLMYDIGATLLLSGIAIYCSFGDDDGRPRKAFEGASRKIDELVAAVRQVHGREAVPE